MVRSKRLYLKCIFLVKHSGFFIKITTFVFSKKDIWTKREITMGMNKTLKDMTLEELWE